MDGDFVDLTRRLCSKVVQGTVTSVDQLSLWNFDGSSTGQAPGHDSEVIIK